MVRTIPPFRVALAVLLLIFLLPTAPIRLQGEEPPKGVVVAQGGVGESGMSSVLQHRVKGAGKKLLVLSTVSSSLCPDTGVVAVLVVNGKPRVHGTLTRPKSAIQVSAGPGDRIIAIAQAIPLHNGIQCIRLGELKLELSERDPAR